jgi:hypothetical protein
MSRIRFDTSLALWLLRTFTDLSPRPRKFFLSRTPLRTHPTITILAASTIVIILLMALLPGLEASLWAQESPQKSDFTSPKPYREYEPLGNPKCDGQMKMLFRNKEFKWQPVLMKPNANEPEKTPFLSDRLWFFYGLNRDEVNRSEGAILIKVIYQYDSGIEDVCIQNKERIGLYRNESPLVNEVDINYDKGHYKAYHQSGRGELYNIFHGSFQRDREKPKERTDQPPARRERFLFPEKQWTREDARERSYLLFYSGVGKEGTWIPFWVGIDRHISLLLLSVIDLSQPGTGQVEYRVSRE